MSIIVYWISLVKKFAIISIFKTSLISKFDKYLPREITGSPQFSGHLTSVTLFIKFMNYFCLMTSAYPYSKKKKLRISLMKTLFLKMNLVPAGLGSEYDTKWALLGFVCFATMYNKLKTLWFSLEQNFNRFAMTHICFLFYCYNWMVS